MRWCGLKVYSYAFKLLSYAFVKHSHAFKINMCASKMQWYTFRAHLPTIKIH